MRLYILVLGIQICLTSGVAYAQESALVDDLLENFENEEIGQTDFLQVLQDLQENPVDVNSAAIRDLLSIPFLDQHVAADIVRYRRENGRFRKAEDLLNVPGMKRELLSAIVPYIRFTTERYNPIIEYRTQLGQPLHKIRGFKERQYSNPLYLYHRLKWQPSESLHSGIIWEKDSGEPDWFDLGSFYLNYHWREAQSRLHLGDYTLETGQGLVFNNAYGTPLSLGSTLPFRNRSADWRPKRAVDENAFLRGALAEYALTGSAFISFAFSRHGLDASLTDDSTAVRSLYKSGYHRTKLEKEKQDRVDESLLAATFSLNVPSIQLGIQAAQIEYSLPIQIEENLFRKEFTYLSGFYSVQKSLLVMQGEAALLNGKFPALQQTFFVSTTDPTITYGALFYYYHPEYWTFHGRGFGSISGEPSNEAGYFLSIGARIFPGTDLAAYFHASRPARSSDDFNFLKRSRQVQLTQKLNQTRFTLRLSHRIRRGRPVSPARKYMLSEQSTRVLRFHTSTNLSKKLRFSHRLEVSWADSSLGEDKHYGFSFYQDIRYRAGAKFSLQARWTQFEIPEYDYRLYEFENDLPGNFRNILLNGRGFKWFLLAIFQVSGRVKMSLKYREIYYPDEQSLGGGLDTVFGNRKKELRAQLEFIY